MKQNIFIILFIDKNTIVKIREEKKKKTIIVLVIVLIIF